MTDQPHIIVADCSTGTATAVPMTADQIAAQAAAAATWDGGATSRSVKAQIDALEITITDRRTREAVLGIDNGWLLSVNTQIASLRAQLTS